MLEVHEILYGQHIGSDNKLQKQAERFATMQGLANRLVSREPFLGKANQLRLDNLYVTKEWLERIFFLFLDRRPNEEEIRRILVGGWQRKRISRGQFIRKLLKSREYKKKSSPYKLMKRMSFNSVPRTLFLHVPKTAGKSFEQLVIRNYGRSAVSLSTSGKFAAAEWNRSAVIGGHFIYPKFDGMTGKRLFLAVVRDPVYRALSRFNYYVNAEHQKDFRIARGFDPGDPLKTMLYSSWKVEFVDDYQCRYLSGQPSLQGVMEAFQNDAFIVGTFDELRDWTTRVGSRLGWTDTELDRINVASDPDYMKELLANKELVENLRERNQEDYALYNFIRKRGVYESAGTEFDYSDFSVTSQLQALANVDSLSDVSSSRLSATALFRALKRFLS